MTNMNRLYCCSSRYYPLVGFFFGVLLLCAPTFANTYYPYTANWNNPGTCTGSAHWILSPAQNVTAAKLNVGGVWYTMNQSGGGSFSADSTNHFDANTLVYAEYAGTFDASTKIVLSHCISVCGNGVTEDGETCDDSNTTSGDGCSAICQDECVNPTTDCGSTDLCAQPVCVATAGGGAQCSIQYKDQNTVCRTSDGVCDQAEYCTGSSASCPVDTFQSPLTLCHASAGLCDVPEYCTGESATCPEDVFQSSQTLCNASAGDCDVPEYCTGESATCPTDAFKSADTICNDANGLCDVAEKCTGSSAQCPSDGFLPQGTVCHLAAGDCDVAEVCTGSAPQCPADALMPPGTVCHAASGECDVAELCTGSAVSCPTDGYKTAGTPCTDTDGTLCTIAECNGANSCVQDYANVSCDDNDVCTDNVCIASTGACDYPDTFPTPPGCNDGCTPGYWKNNYDKKDANAWPIGYTNLTVKQEFFDKTGIQAPLGLATNICSGQYSNLTGKKLSDALAFKGGSTLNGKAQILLRAASAAVLNATNNCFSYPYSETEIIDKVQSALNSCNGNLLNSLATELDTLNNAFNNNLHCPLDQQGSCAY